MEARVKIYKDDAIIWEVQAKEALGKQSADAHAPGRVRNGDKFTFEFTGKHDHGDLEARKQEGGSLDKLSHFLSIVKEESREVLAEESKKPSDASTEGKQDGNVPKKQKVED